LATSRASKNIFVDVNFGGKPSNSTLGGKKALVTPNKTITIRCYRGKP
jgi:hypothetical protein